MLATHERSVHRLSRILRSTVSLGWLVVVPFGAASAEVCAKVVSENWTPDLGPVWLLNPVEWSPGLLSFVVVMAASLVWRWPRVLLAGAALMTSTALLGLLADVLPGHDVYRAAVAEGCRSIPTDVADAIICLMAAVGLGVMALRQFLKNGKTARTEAS